MVGAGSYMMLKFKRSDKPQRYASFTEYVSVLGETQMYVPGHGCLLQYAAWSCMKMEAFWLI